MLFLDESFSFFQEDNAVPAVIFRIESDKNPSYYDFPVIKIPSFG